MDNLITGLIGIGIFLAFIIGLAESINAIPFMVIVGVVSCMAGFDFYQSARDGLNKDKNNNS